MKDQEIIRGSNNVVVLKQTPLSYLLEYDPFNQRLIFTLEINFYHILGSINTKKKKTKKNEEEEQDEDDDDDEEWRRRR